MYAVGDGIVLQKRKCKNGIWDFEWTPLQEVATIEKAGLMSVEDKLALTKVINKTFPLELSISFTPSTIQEYTGNNKTIKINWNSKIDGELIIPTNTKLTIGGNTITSGITQESKIYSYQASVNNDTTITVTTEAEGRSTSQTETINFAYPSYTGIVDNDFIINESNIKSLTKMNLVDNKTQTYTYSSHTNKKIVYAYAAVYKDLVNVIGPANTDFIHLFQKETTTINGIAYNVYIYKEIRSAGGSLTYNFK